jgi:adenylate cyclase
VPNEQADEALGYLVLDDGEPASTMPIFGQLFVGRECVGVSESRRLVIDDPEISRNHLEIRLDPETDQAFVIDTSTNGTSVNGMRLVRGLPRRIRPNDTIQIGNVALTFRSTRFNGVAAPDSGYTRARISSATMVMVVGDITNYSTIAQFTDSTVIARSLNLLWHELGTILTDYQGTLNHYAGDALYAVWELEMLPRANELAIDFALAANRRVEQLGPELPLRGKDGSPIHMGWGVVRGTAALAAMTRSVEAVIGDSTNVAFRLAGLAGRHGRAAVMVTNAVHAAVEADFSWGDAEHVEIKGRDGVEIVYPVIARVDGA